MLYYCGYDSFLQFKNALGKNGVFVQPLSDLILDENDKVINAFLGWCSLFLQTGNGQILYLGYAKNKSVQQGLHVEKSDLIVCEKIPKYIVNIECGSKQTFVISIDHELFKWSDTDFIKTFPTKLCLADDTSPEKTTTPEALQKHKAQYKVQEISVGIEYSAILTDNGQVYLIDPASGTVGRLISGSERISLISAGQEHLLLLTEDGRVQSYGNGTRGQLGRTTLEAQTEAAATIEALEGIECMSIAAGGWHSMALSKTGDVYVWGWNESGQLGLSQAKITMKTEPFPLEVSEDDHFVNISAGSRHSMVVSENGILFGWGWNKWGQLGLPPTKEKPFYDSPQVIPIDERVSHISCKFWSSLIETDEADDD